MKPRDCKRQAYVFWWCSSQDEIKAIGDDVRKLKPANADKVAIFEKSANGAPAMP